MMSGVEQYTQYFDELNSKTRRLSWQVGAALAQPSHSFRALAEGGLA